MGWRHKKFHKMKYFLTLRLRSMLLACSSYGKNTCYESVQCNYKKVPMGHLTLNVDVVSDMIRDHFPICETHLMHALTS